MDRLDARYSRLSCRCIYKKKLWSVELMVLIETVAEPGAIDENATTEIDRYRIHVSTDQTFTDLAESRDLEIDNWLSPDSVDALLADTAYFPAPLGSALANNPAVEVRAAFLTEELGEKLAAGECYYWKVRSEKAMAAGRRAHGPPAARS